MAHELLHSEPMSRLLPRPLAVLVGTFALLVGYGGPADAGDVRIAVGEISTPPVSSGVDVGNLRDAAEGEIRQIDLSKLPPRRRLVISLAVTRAAIDPIACTINATVRDAKTGAMMAIIEAGAKSDGPVSPALKKQVADAAVRSAVRRIPGVLVTSR
jgi:hypothetical protein